MIQLTRLNNTRLAVNPDLIKYVEQAPDTVITLVNGEKLLVLESAEEVIDRFREFRHSMLAGTGVSCCNGHSNGLNPPHQSHGAHTETNSGEPHCG